MFPTQSLPEGARQVPRGSQAPLPPPTNLLDEGGQNFAALRRAVPKPRAQEARKNSWISATTWILVNKIVSARRDIAKDQLLIRRLGCAIKVILREERKRRVEEAGAEVETLLWLDPPLHREAWHRIKGWYKAAVNRAPPSARVTFKRITS